MVIEIRKRQGRLVLMSIIPHHVEPVFPSIDPGEIYEDDEEEEDD